MKKFDSTLVARVIFNKVRSQVSTDRLRTKDEETAIELDLSYITSNIIAMAMPAEGVASFYRNAIEDVVEFLKKHHDNNYMIWNLSEHEYDVEKFDNQVINCMFPDHHPPPFDRLLKVVTSIDNWLKADTANVAVIHCKGGKGRTGTVIVCALFFSGICSTIEESDELFAKRRSETGMGVTQPSQRRYIQYFNSVFTEDKYINLQAICIRSLTLSPMPIGQTYVLEIYDSVIDGNLIFRTLHPPILPGTTNPVIHFDINIDAQGDLYFKLLRKKRKTRESLEKEFHICLNTMFIDTVTIELKKSEMDTIREKRYSDDLTLTIAFGPPMNESQHPTTDPLIERMIQQFSKDDIYKKRRQASQLTLRKAKSNADTKFIHPLLRSTNNASRMPGNVAQTQPPSWQTVKIEQVSDMDASKMKGAGWVSSRASGVLTKATSRSIITNPHSNAASSSSTSSVPSSPQLSQNSKREAAPQSLPSTPSMQSQSDMRQRSTNRMPPPPRIRSQALPRPGSMQIAPGSLKVSADGESFTQMALVENSPSDATASSERSETASASSPPAGRSSSTSSSVADTSSSQSSSPSTSARSSGSDPIKPVAQQETPTPEQSFGVDEIVPLSAADNEFRSVLLSLEAIGIAGAARVGRYGDLSAILDTALEEDVPPLPTGFIPSTSNPSSLASSVIESSDEPAVDYEEPSITESAVAQSNDTGFSCTADVASTEPQEAPVVEEKEPAPSPTPVIPAFPSFPAFNFIPTNAFSQFIPKPAAKPEAPAPVQTEVAEVATKPAPEDNTSTDATIAVVSDGASALSEGF